jgi:hypothetical protein
LQGAQDLARSLGVVERECGGAVGTDDLGQAGHAPREIGAPGRDFERNQRGAGEQQRHAGREHGDRRELGADREVLDVEHVGV